MSAYEPLHHKYRPQTFADLVGQEAIAQTLTNAINRQRIAPAYLFTGPRGTGKTSSARILAKSLNCLTVDVPTPTPCGKCEVCRAIARGSAMDVIEIDAASNTGVDNIREIIERSQFAPVQCRFKVYVIDECHMLSTAAFNALLKTLEEPPDRVIFVLATTDPQRVLPTIISRCQRFDYRRIPLGAMVNHLTIIAQNEAIAIAPDALTLVAQLANGGLRDAESLLDQLSLLSGTITPEKVWDLVGAVSEQDLLALLEAIRSNDPETAIATCRQILDRGREPLVLLQNLAAFYLNLLIAKSAPQRADMVALTEQTWKKLCTMAPQWQLTTILRGQQHLKESEIQIRNATQPRLWLEVTLLGLLPAATEIPFIPVESTAANRAKDSTLVPATIAPTTIAPTTIAPIDSPSPLPSNGNGQVKPNLVPLENGQAIAVESRVTSSTVLPEPVNAPGIEPSATINLESMWQQLLGQLQPMTKALLQSHCHLLKLEGGMAKIGVKSEPLLRHAQNKLPEVEATFAQICQRTVRVNFLVDGSSSSPSASTSPQPFASDPRTVVVAPPPTQERSPTNPPSPPPSSPPEHRVAPPLATAITVESPAITLDSASYSASDLQKAAATLAKLFEGEVIDLEDQPLEPEDKTGESEKAIAPEKPLILGRPDLSAIADDDDIPF